MSQVWVAFALNNCEGVPANELPAWLRDPQFAQNINPVERVNVSGKTPRYSQINPNLRKRASKWDF
jgi:hypothetical protein